MDDDAAEATQSFAADADICQQLLTRYARSSAAQHRHLCATAAATRSIIQSSSLPLTPISYFAATITSLSTSKNLDANALGAITSFISIVLPLVGRDEIKPEKATEAIRILVTIVDRSGGKLGTSGVRAVVKCVGALVAEFCNLEEWDSVALGFEWLLKFSLDKRPKVRKCAQDCLLKVFKSFESSAISKMASKSIYSLLKDHMQSATEMSSLKIRDGNKHEPMTRPEHQDVLHLLNVMKHVVPHFSPKVRTRMLPLLLKITSSHFSVVTRHVLDIISAIFATSGAEVIISNANDIFSSLLSYISLGEKNPPDSVLVAANLAKAALGRLHNDDVNEWTSYFPMLTESLAGLLSSKGNVALQTSIILRELIDQHIDGKSFEAIENLENEDKTTQNAEFNAVQTTCTTFYNLMSGPSPILNEYLFSVVAFLFLKLGKISHVFMKPILLKLSELMNNTSTNTSEVKHLEACIGSAVAAIGPERLLSLLPISLTTKEFSCKNVWLIPILNKNIIGSSLQFFMEHIVTLAESFERGSSKVKKSVIGQDLQAYAHGCWGLFPAFCRWPSDTYQSFGSLSKLLISFLKKDSFMLENVAIGLQELVNENKRVLASNCGSVQLTEVQRTGVVNEFEIDLERRHVYSRKTASKNIKALALCAKELLLSLTDVLLESPPETRKHLKGAIGCLTSICDPSVTKQVFIASLEKLQILDDINDDGKLKSDTDGLAKEKENSVTDATRCLILELASCIVEGSDEDLVNLLFSITKRALEESDEAGQMEAYQTLSTILEKHSGFGSSQFDVVMGLLTEKKSSANIELVKSRFTCLQALLIRALMSNMDEENTKSFLILNEIILTLKDSNEEGRNVAYDALHGLSSKLRNSADASFDGIYHKLLTMFTGYLSGPSPHIKSGVVSALSILIYSDPTVCITMPEVVPSVMELLHSKAIEVIKAVLGFVKVLVSCLPVIDLHHFLSDIMDGVLRWSSVSRHHFKEKIVVILEIMMRKCGTAKVKALAPEKYKDFVQGVVENRHGKKSSKESGNKDAKPDHSDSSLKGQQKRKRDESATSSKEEGSSARPWKKTMDRQQNVGKSWGKNGHSNHSGLNKGKFNKPRGGDFKMKHSGEKKNNEGNLHRRDVASKTTKHKKRERKD
ncbi:hypothetical protein ACS0TY_025441 [Phlomoides rotata]